MFVTNDIQYKRTISSSVGYWKKSIQFTSLGYTFIYRISLLIQYQPVQGSVYILGQWFRKQYSKNIRRKPAENLLFSGWKRPENAQNPAEKSCGHIRLPFVAGSDRIRFQEYCFHEMTGIIWNRWDPDRILRPGMYIHINVVRQNIVLLQWFYSTDLFL